MDTPTDLHYKKLPSKGQRLCSRSEKGFYINHPLYIVLFFLLFYNVLQLTNQLHLALDDFYEAKL